MGPLILNLELLDASFCPAAHQDGNTTLKYLHSLKPIWLFSANFSFSSRLFTTNFCALLAPR